MTNRPQTIQIFLPGGDPQGIRVAEITTRIMQVIEVPRSLLKDFLAMPESDQVALYFLFGESDDESEKKVYIGQSGDPRSRLTSHNQNKDFWERALIVISRTNSLTQTHSVFLEWYCLQQSRVAGRYTDENGNSGSRPHTPAPLEADCLEMFDTAKTLLATLGYPIFDPVAMPAVQATQQELFYCKGPGADGRGLYTTEGFVVLKGSTARKENVASIVGTSVERMREKLLSAGVFAIEGQNYIFQKDHLFGSPSSAAMAVLGRTANGWEMWKDAADLTLDQLKRQQVVACL